MNSKKHKESSNLLHCIIHNKCPQCRIGHMFEKRNPYNLKYTIKMKQRCQECGQQFMLEPGFYFGTGYVSYGLSIALSVAFFIATWVLVGFSLQDNSLYYWLFYNTILLIIAQPPMMRLSRAIWLSFFVKYKEKEKHKELQPAHLNK